jgi:hypothetical protein
MYAKLPEVIWADAKLAARTTRTATKSSFFMKVKPPD